MDRNTLSDEGSIGLGRLGVNKKYVARYGQGLTGQRSALRLKGCGVMQELIWVVIPNGKAFFEHTPPVQPVFPTLYMAKQWALSPFVHRWGMR